MQIKIYAVTLNIFKWYKLAGSLRHCENWIQKR